MTIKFLANEMCALGEDFIASTITEQCVKEKDGEDGIAVVLFDIGSLIVICRMLGFECSLTDQGDLKAWLQSKDLTTRPPQQLQTLRRTVFIDKDRLIKELKAYKREHFHSGTPRHEASDAFSALNQDLRLKRPQRGTFAEYQNYLAKKIIAAPLSQALQAIEYYQEEKLAAHTPNRDLGNQIDPQKD